MTISYNWLCEYFPDNLLQKPNPDQLSRILTSIGLEVETLHPYSSLRGSLQGLLVGEVISAEPHPNADKLKITQVNTGPEKIFRLFAERTMWLPGKKWLLHLWAPSFILKREIHYRSKRQKSGE